MSNEILTIVIVIPTIVGIALGAYLGYLAGNEGYEKGQIDALNGKQNYRLLEFPDGTRDYYHKDKMDGFDKENQNYIIIK